MYAFNNYKNFAAKLIVKINSMKGKNLSIMAMIAAVFCSVLADSNLHKNAVLGP